MSAYNTLSAKIQCSACNNSYYVLLQFKFGDTWQYHYQLGDSLKWGGNDIGKPQISCVNILGVLETDTCPICKLINKNQEYDIILENDILTNVLPLSNKNDYIESAGENYCIIEN